MRIPYDLSTGEFKVIAKTLAYVMVRGMKMKHFFSCGFSKDKFKVLYACVKKRI